MEFDFPTHLVCRGCEERSPQILLRTRFDFMGPMRMTAENRKRLPEGWRYVEDHSADEQGWFLCPSCGADEEQGP